MKKYLLLPVLMLTTLFLVACGNKDTIPNGKYYHVSTYDGERLLKLEFKEDTAFWYGGNGDVAYSITDIDTEKKQFTVSVSGQNIVSSYELSDDGKLTILTGEFNGDYYREDSKALEEVTK
ncbi:TPA: hypothetical protein TXJ13_000078 [Streptococcus suis]|nr:hypothetical protein [Streptococcus suis]HEL2321565.1 hypothetical protein [Streptococcus suis]